MTKIQQIATEKSADHIVIEAPAHSDLITLAKTFTVADDKGEVLSDVAHIESLVTVIDAQNLLSTLKTEAARDLIERIEFANVIVIDGIAGVSHEQYERVLSSLKALNSDANIVRGDEDQLLASMRVSRPFDPNRAQARSARVVVNQTNSSDAIVQFVYRVRPPFHPARLHRLIGQPWSGVLRAQGTFWVASRPDLAGLIDIAGGSRTVAPVGQWWATVPEENRPNSPEFQEYVEESWHPSFGDRHQEITVIGIDVDVPALRSSLDQCLLTDAELADPDGWSAMSDPFPWPEELL